MFSSSGSNIFVDSGFRQFEDSPHIVVRYEKAPVYFRLSQRGKAIEIHIACEGREGKMAIREASKAVILFVKAAYKDCECLIAPVSIKSVYNLCMNLGFEDRGIMMFDEGPANVMVIDYV